MIKEFKDKWVEALKSGKYEQGTGKLRSNDNKFCCLGVLCDIIDPSDWWQSIGENNYNYISLEGHLPTTIKNRTSITQENEENLIKMNDKGKSFIEIAKYIEENL